MQGSFLQLSLISLLWWSPFTLLPGICFSLLSLLQWCPSSITSLNRISSIPLLHRVKTLYYNLLRPYQASNCTLIICMYYINNTYNHTVFDFWISCCWIFSNHDFFVCDRGTQENLTEAVRSCNSFQSSRFFK